MLRKQLIVVTLFVLALRLPFLNQAIQGDDLYYLYGAEHAQVEPLHPTHAKYAFLGQVVDMRGHPHPPLDSWYLGGLLAIFREVSEIPFHAGYIPFSMIAAWSALALARRFSPFPLAATLLFLVTPAFVVNGNSLESDVPFAAFWLASVALFVAAVDRRSRPLLAASAIAMVGAAMTAYQAVILVPILLLYGRKWKLACLTAFVGPAVIGLWQIYERSTSGELPVVVLAGYMQTYGLQAFAQKIKNAAALTGHLGWLVFPLLPLVGLRHVRYGMAALALPVVGVAAFFDPSPLFWGSIAAGLLILLYCLHHLSDFLSQWILLFFAAALIIFFAGSARYLLPIALPLAILVSARLSRRWLYSGVACGLALSLCLAIVNYQHWDGYRQVARSLNQDIQTKRVWINGEWGLRFYLESAGALPLLQNQPVHPGEMVVSSSLAYPLNVTTAGGVLATVAEREITSAIPLRLVALNGRSAYSTTLFGLRPFDISTGPIDRVRAEIVIERKPEMERLPMNAPTSGRQIVSGIFDIENGQWRWMGKKAILLLKSPAGPAPLIVRFFIPPQAPARTMTVFVGETQVASRTYSAPGAYTLTTNPIRFQTASTTITIIVDKTFSVAGDARELGIILLEVGF